MSRTHLFKNPYVWGYALVYLSSMLLLNSMGVYSISNALAILLIVGVSFSALVYFLTRSAIPMEIDIRLTKAEVLFTILALLVIVWYLTWGRTLMEFSSPPDPILDLLLKASVKILIFVAIPVAVLMGYFKYSLRDLGVQFRGTGKQWKSHLPVMLGMAFLLLIFNYFVGQGAQPIRQGQFSGSLLIMGLPLSFLWIMLDVGLVEEFFFRSFLQTRISAWLRSDLAGIIITCLIFGLAHAPGLFLRGASSVTVLGDTPTLLQSIAYSVVVLSVAGFFLGLIWIRTKNLIVLMFVHAAVDLLPGFNKLVSALHLNLP